MDVRSANEGEEGVRDFQEFALWWNHLPRGGDQLRRDKSGRGDDGGCFGGMLPLKGLCHLQVEMARG